MNPPDFTTTSVKEFVLEKRVLRSFATIGEDVLISMPMEASQYMEHSQYRLVQSISVSLYERLKAEKTFSQDITVETAFQLELERPKFLDWLLRRKKKIFQMQSKTVEFKATVSMVEMLKNNPVTDDRFIRIVAWEDAGTTWIPKDPPKPF